MLASCCLGIELDKLTQREEEREKERERGGDHGGVGDPATSPSAKTRNIRQLAEGLVPRTRNISQFPCRGALGGA